MKKILVVDDEVEILKLVKNILKMNDSYQVTLLESVEPFSLETFEGYDLIILDIMLKGLYSGYDICSAIRDKINTPILFLTAKTTEQDLLKGFSYGADDYIKKPFSPMELLARVKAHIDRNDRFVQPIAEKMEFGEIVIDEHSKSVLVRAENINLTNLEYKILHFLASNNSRVYTAEDIYFEVYNADKDSLLRNVSMHIYQIRKKFKKYDLNPVKTVWGIGYKWEV